jgi:carotenoid cleavage dioxygenase-like enzyme
MSAALTDKPSVAGGRLRGFHSVEVECAPTDLPVRGNLPAWLAGTYLLNGPAQWELPKRSYRHWFDGRHCCIAFVYATGVCDTKAVSFSPKTGENHMPRADRNSEDSTRLFRAG